MFTICFSVRISTLFSTFPSEMRFLGNDLVLPRQVFHNVRHRHKDNLLHDCFRPLQSRVCSTTDSWMRSSGTREMMRRCCVAGEGESELCKVFSKKV